MELQEYQKEGLAGKGRGVTGQAHQCAFDSRNAENVVILPPYYAAKVGSKLRPGQAGSKPRNASPRVYSSLFYAGWAVPTERIL